MALPISQLPPAPLRTDAPDVFIAKADVFLPALNTLVTDINTALANINSVAAGGTYAIPYSVDLSTQTAADPGNGRMKFSAASVLSSTAIYLDTLSYGAIDVSAILDSFNASTSVAIKGKVRFVKLGDVTKWAIFDVISVVTASGYRQLTVANGLGSSPTPFATSDIVIMLFQPVGERGDVGPQGSLFRRVSQLTTNNPNVQANDMQWAYISGGSFAISTPTGTGGGAYTPTDGQSFVLRLKDDGTARALIWNTAWRQSSDLYLPTSTVANRTLYVGFLYNANDAKWDLVTVLNNF